MTDWITEKVKAIWGDRKDVINQPGQLLGNVGRLPLGHSWWLTNGTTIEPLYPQPKLVDENTPKDRPLLMFWTKYGWAPSEGWNENCKFWQSTLIDQWQDDNSIAPTHWMEMPDDPPGTDELRAKLAEKRKEEQFDFRLARGILADKTIIAQERYALGVQECNEFKHHNGMLNEIHPYTGEITKRYYWNGLPVTKDEFKSEQAREDREKRLKEHKFDESKYVRLDPLPDNIQRINIEKFIYENGRLTGRIVILEERNAMLLEALKGLYDNWYDETEPLSEAGKKAKRAIEMCEGGK